MPLGEANAQLSFQGYTGYINAPSAGLTSTGWLDAQYSNNVEAEARPGIVTADRYSVSLGLASWLEFGGRIVDQGPPGFGSRSNTFEVDGPADRDLSAHAKIRLYQHDRLPNVAVGIMDYGGNEKFRTEYAVLGNQHGRFEYSLGWARGRMDGVIWGVGVELLPYVQIVADDDSVQRSFAIRADTDALFSRWKLRASYRFAASGPRADNAFALGVSRELGGWQHEPSRVQPPVTLGEPPGVVRPARPAVAHRPPVGQTCETALVRRLRSLGMERVSVQARGDGLWVAYEGVQYARSAVDGLGVVLGGIVNECAGGFERVRVQDLLHGQARFWIEVSLAELAAYFGPQRAEEPRVIFGWGAARKPREGEEPAVPHGRRETWAELRFDPAYSYVIASEPALFNYSVALQSRLTVPLWAGATLGTAWQQAIDDSEHYEDGSFFANAALDDRWLVRYQFRQAFWLSRYALLAGYLGETEIFRFDNRLYGAELALIPFADGRFTLYSRQMRYKPIGAARQIPGARTVETWTNTARYFWPSTGVSTEWTWGRYANRDEGMRVQVARLFGDTEIGLRYRADKDQQTEFLGLFFRAPWTPTRSLRAGPVRVQGPEQQTFVVQTLINQRTNAITFGRGVERLPLQNLQDDFLDRGRLSSAYIVAAWPRMREIHRRMGRGG